MVGKNLIEISADSGKDKTTTQIDTPLYAQLFAIVHLFMLLELTNVFTFSRPKTKLRFSMSLQRTTQI